MAILFFLEKMNLTNFFWSKNALELYPLTFKNDFSKTKDSSEWNFQKFIIWINWKKNISEKFAQKGSVLLKVSLS